MLKINEITFIKRIGNLIGRNFKNGIRLLLPKVTHHLMKQQIIDIAIKHWNKSFVGISACDIAKELNLSHNEVMASLEELKDEDKGSLNQNVSLGQISIKIDKETKKVKSEHSTIITHIYFPSKEIFRKILF